MISGPCSALLEPIRIQRSTARSSPEKAPTSLGPRGVLADRISGIAVLKYGPPEILPPVGAISKHPARLYRPGRQVGPAPRAESRGFSTFETGCARETDSPLEGDGFELLVPRHKSPRFPKHPGTIAAPTI